METLINNCQNSFWTSPTIWGTGQDPLWSSPLPFRSACNQSVNRKWAESFVELPPPFRSISNESLNRELQEFTLELLTDCGKFLIKSLVGTGQGPLWSPPRPFRSVCIKTLLKRGRILCGAPTSFPFNSSRKPQCQFARISFWSSPAIFVSV